METFKIDYKSCKSELCEIGKHCDTDKSPQRNNVNNYRHCHAYTLFYDGIFRNNKNDNLKIAELGVAYGSSLLMWQVYFPHAEIYGFELYEEYINNFKKNFNNERIILANLDVTKKDCIIKTFNDLNIFYDIIIEDTTHQFEDQIRVIENTYKYLKPGGILIVEDIFKSYNEIDYYNRLKPILHNFQDYYFIEVKHNNSYCPNWDNEKLLILIKGGAEPIFKNAMKS